MSGFRRTWDKKAYEEKAQQRLEGGLDEEEDGGPKLIKKPKKEEFQQADEDAEGPMGSSRAFLQARRDKIDVESKVGKIEVVDPSNIEKGAGYYCEVCVCLLKDSASYLDHINGKKHQRALGFSMRVERASIDKVQDRLAALKKAVSEKAGQIKPSAIDEHNQRVSAAISEEEERKRKKKEERARKDEALEKDLEDADPEMAALLGFGGFNSSKK